MPGVFQKPWWGWQMGHSELGWTVERDLVFSRSLACSWRLVDVCCRPGYFQVLVVSSCQPEAIKK